MALLTVLARSKLLLPPVPSLCRSARHTPCATSI
jgi:hypothetical protein